MHNITNKKSKRLTPENFSEFFSSESDEQFKSKHPIGYRFLVALGITVLIMPMIAYLVVMLTFEKNGFLLLVGQVGSLIFGIGLFNFVAKIIGQYLGLRVSLFSFLIGTALMTAAFFLT